MGPKGHTPTFRRLTCGVTRADEEERDKKGEGEEGGRAGLHKRWKKSRVSVNSKTQKKCINKEQVDNLWKELCEKPEEEEEGLEKYRVAEAKVVLTKDENQDLKDKLRRNKKLRSLEERLPRLKE